MTPKTAPPRQTCAPRIPAKKPDHPTRPEPIDRHPQSILSGCPARTHSRSKNSDLLCAVDGDQDARSISRAKIYIGLPARKTVIPTPGNLSAAAGVDFLSDRWSHHFP